MNNELRVFRGFLIGCGLGLFCLILILFACRALTAEGMETAVYLPIVQAQPPDVGIAWCSGCPANAEKLSAYYWYGCCNTCPDPKSGRLAIMRPGWEWSSQCAGDYAGEIITGNEGEFRGQDGVPAQEMADFIIATSAAYPDATLICINSYDLTYAAAVMELLPPGTCAAFGVHIYGDVDVSAHLDQLCTDCRIWVTEVGACDGDLLRRLVLEARFDERVERIFGYTAVGSVNPCADMLDSAGNLTPVGEGFTAGLEAYP